MSCSRERWLCRFASHGYSASEVNAWVAELFAARFGSVATRIGSHPLRSNGRAKAFIGVARGLARKNLVGNRNEFFKVFSDAPIAANDVDADSEAIRWLVEG
eukprot:4323945-Amphidinium_carterae.1